MFKAIGERGGDFGEEGADFVRGVAPLLEAALQGFEMLLAGGVVGGRCSAEAVEAAAELDGLGEVSVELASERGGEAGGVAGAEGRVGDAVGDGAADLDVGVASVGELQWPVDVGDDGEHAAGGGAVVEFGADEGGFPAGGADPGYALEVAAGEVGKGLSGVGIGGFDAAGLVDQFRPPFDGYVGGEGGGFEAGLFGEHGSDPALDGAIEPGIGREEGAAFEEFGEGAFLPADEGDGGRVVVIDEGGPVLSAEGLGGGFAIEEDENRVGRGAFFPGFGDGRGVFLHVKSGDIEVAMQPFSQAFCQLRGSRRTTNAQLHLTIGPSPRRARQPLMLGDGAGGPLVLLGGEGAFVDAVEEVEAGGEKCQPGVAAALQDGAVFGPYDDADGRH